MKPTRRDLLKALGVASAAVAAGCAPPEDVVPRVADPTLAWSGGDGAVDHARFPTGVAAGDPRPDRIILWTRYVGDVALEVAVATWDGTTWLEEDPVPVRVAATGHVHHDLADRAPDTPLAYQFRDADGRLSPIGRARTAMARGQRGIVRLAATSCTHQSHPGFPSLPAAMAQGPVDLFCWLGDAAYFDGRRTPEEFQALWHHNLSDEGFRAVLAHTASTFTWDDHEVTNNWNSVPVLPEGLLEVATEAFFANTPTRRDPAHPRRIWRSLRMGATAEVFVLDCRGERDERAGVYLSEAQMQWLIDGLIASPCPWKIVLNSVPFARLPGAYLVPVALEDRWEGYPDDRQRLLDAIVEHDVRGVLFVSGDIHQPALIRAEAEGPASRVLDFIVGPGGSWPQPLGMTIRGLPGVEWSYQGRNTGLVELHPLGLARLRVIGEEGEDLMSTWIDVRGNLFDFSEIEPDA